MISNIGLFAILLAIFLGFTQLITALYGLSQQNFNIMKQTKKITMAQSILVMIAFFSLLYGFVIVDLSNQYIASQANITLPWYYRIAGIWSAREGSLLLWSAALAFWTILFVIRGRRLPLSVHSTAIGFLGLINSLFLLLVLLFNPFAKNAIPPWHGGEVQPLLQDAGLLIHPLFLYVGYTGFVIVFVMTLAGLLQRRINSQWAQWSIQWVRGSWALLTVGIVLGSWWAYNELGWGGIWFWDPVENASLFPWLAGLGLMHALFVMKRKIMMKNYIVLLGISTFLLSVIGTFVVRSGLLVSVHSFTSDPTINVALIGLIILLAALGYGMFFKYHDVPRSAPKSFKWLSIIGLIRLQSYLVLMMLLIVLWGTLYPLALKLIGNSTITVGAPYFHQALSPFVFLLLIVMSQFHCLYKKQTLFWRAWPASVMVGTFTSALLYFLANHTYPVTLFILMAAFFTNLASIVYLLILNLFEHKTIKSHSGVIALAHAGFTVMVMGLMGNVLFSQMSVSHVRLNETWHFHGYTLELKQRQEKTVENYIQEQFHISVSKNNQLITTLLPSRRTYISDQKTIESAIKYGILYDLHLTVGEPIDNTRIQVGFGIKYMTSWTWLGGLLMAFGALLNIKGHRHNMHRKTPANRSSHLRSSQPRDSQKTKQTSPNRKNQKRPYRPTRQTNR